MLVRMGESEPRPTPRTRAPSLNISAAGLVCSFPASGLSAVGAGMLDRLHCKPSLSNISSYRDPLRCAAPVTRVRTRYASHRVSAHIPEGLGFIFVSPFYGVLLLYAFSFGNFHTLTWGGLGDLYLAYVIVVLTGISWLLSFTEKKRLPLSPLVVLTLLFSLWITVTSYFALAPAAVVWDRWVFVQKVLLMCLVGYALTTTRERVNQLIWVVVLSIGFWGVKGALSFILHGGGGTVGIHGPDGGVTAANNEFGIALVMILPLLLYQWHIAVNRHIRRGLIVMGFLVSLAVIFTYSRGALLALCAMGASIWLRSRAKFTTGLLILAVGFFVYSFVPQHWFDRMATIQTYETESSASSRIDLWKISLRIAELNPILGGGFWVTYSTDITNAMLAATTLPRLTIPRAAHSIWFEILSEHGWVGLALFVMIGISSWRSCASLVGHARGRPDLAWANLLGRMGQGALVGFWAGGSFNSMAYFDEYWCIMFMLDAARRVVAKEITIPVKAFPTAPAMGMIRHGTAGTAPT
jgi:probable O-glycosylation ligase (exosortase A-associated)